VDGLDPARVPGFGSRHIGESAGLPPVPVSLGDDFAPEPLAESR
jgi:hypothetical protein